MSNYNDHVIVAEFRGKYYKSAVIAWFIRAMAQEGVFTGFNEEFQVLLWQLPREPSGANFFVMGACAQYVQMYLNFHVKNKTFKMLFPQKIPLLYIFH